MAEYRRFIAYFYEYIDGKRQRNAGFVKVEQRGDEWKLQLQLRASRWPEQGLPVYGYDGEGDNFTTFLLGTGYGQRDSFRARMEYRGGQGEGETWVIHGMWIPRDEHRCYVSHWLEGEIDPQKLKLPDMGELAGEISEPEREPGQAASGLEREPGRAVSGLESEPGRAVSEMENFRESEDAGDDIAADAGEEQRWLGPGPVLPERNAGDQAEPGRDQVQEIQPETQDIQRGEMREGGGRAVQGEERLLGTGRAEEDTRGEEGQRLQEFFAGMNVHRSQKEEPQQCLEAMRRVRAGYQKDEGPEDQGRADNEKAEQDRTAGDHTEGSQAAGGGIEQEQPDPDKSEERQTAGRSSGDWQMSEGNSQAGTAGENGRLAAWESLGRTRRRIRPFGGDSMEWAVICPGDVMWLRGQGWPVGKNSFLARGFLRYRHLLLGRDADGSFVLGVPGGETAEDGRAARSFGFPEFRAADTESGVDSEFGYWCRRFELR